MQEALSKLDIPLFTTSHDLRATLPERVMAILADWKVTQLFANVEYAVDELRRDIRVCELANQGGTVRCAFVHDKCIIAPGAVKTKEGRGYTVRVTVYLTSGSTHRSDLGLFALPSSLAAAPH